MCPSTAPMNGSACPCNGDCTYTNCMFTTCHCPTGAGNKIWSCM
jgi:hypothetical protein